jgi:hypothetical protein
MAHFEGDSRLRTSSQSSSFNPGVLVRPAHTPSCLYLPYTVWADALSSRLHDLEYHLQVTVQDSALTSRRNRTFLTTIERTEVLTSDGMAEVTGLVVGVVPLGVQLAESVQKLRRFHEAMKAAPEKLASIVDEIESLSRLLTEMEGNLVSYDTHAKPGLQRCLASCQKAVDQFFTDVDGLESRIKRHRRRGSLAFIMKSESIEEAVAQLERSKSSLMLAYTLYRGTVADEHVRQMKSAMQILIDGNSLLTEQAIRSRDTCRSNTTIRRVDRKKNLGGNGRDRRTRLRTPSWLSHTIWEILVERATVGWTITLRAYSIVPCDSAIFRACRLGDTSRMNQLFDSGIFEVSVNPTDKQTQKLSFVRWPSGVLKSTLLISFIATTIEH